MRVTEAIIRYLQISFIGSAVVINKSKTKINRGIPKEQWHPVVDRSWQQSVTEEERTQLQNVIAHATKDPSGICSVKTWSLKAFFLETSVFRRAGSRDEYYRMLGEEIQQSVIKMEKDLAKSKSMLTKLKESVQTK